ncbi:MAG: DUF885 family protein [Lachnoclostridium sp.]
MTSNSIPHWLTKAIPGHLYQTVYFASTYEPAPLRSILNFGGYTEGWATYSEMASYYYTSLDKSTATLLQRNSFCNPGIVCPGRHGNPL